MNSRKQNALIGPNQLIKSIDFFSEAVTSYLSPLVRFVGHKDQYYECLYRKFPDLKHEKRYSGKSAHLVVFDELPSDSLLNEAVLSPDSVYIMCLSHQPTDPVDVKSVFRHRVSATLYEPDADVLYWHTKALLMIQDVSFSNGLRSYPELISVDADFRSALATIIASSLNFTSCIACVSSQDARNSLESFLFASMPSLLYPFKIKLEGLEQTDLPLDRITYVQCDCDSLHDLNETLLHLRDNALNKQVITIIVVDKHIYDESVLPIESIYFTDLSARDVDARLIAYWCSMSLSSEYASPRYFSNDQILNALSGSKSEPCLFIDALLNDMPALEVPDPSLTDLVVKYDRPTIDDIFDEAEQRVMEKLQARAVITDAASSAAGIPTVTFRKRMKRLIDKQSFLGLITNNDKYS